MGFLSRKTKPAPPVDESHPISEELELMEKALPETRDSNPATADPAVDGEAVREGDDDRDLILSERPSEPTKVEPEGTVTPKVEPRERIPEEPVKEEERFNARELIAPSRHENFAEEAEKHTDAPVKHAEVIAFANQKGGVAKTTTTLNLAVAFAESGYRVLCIDLDPQGNLTMSQGIDPDKVEKSLYDVLVNDMPISEIIVKREIDIAVASIDLAGAEIAMSTKIGRERSLEKALKEVIADYDFVCIDTPPSLGLLTINALTAANKVIVPVQC